MASPKKRRHVDTMFGHRGGQRLFSDFSRCPLCVEEPAEIRAVQFNEAAPPTSGLVFGRPENAEAVMTDCMFYRRLIAITDKVGFQVGAFLTFLRRSFDI